MAAKSNRFIVVYRDEASTARRLIDEMNVDGVEVVTYQGGTAPSPDFYKWLSGNPGAEITLVRVKEKFRRKLDPECKRLGIVIVGSFSSMKIAESAIRSWLIPKSAPERELASPSDAFRGAAQTERRLVIAEHALDDADSLSELRYSFANDAARALAEYAQRVGTNLGDLSEFFSQRGVQHALKGQIVAHYKVTVDGRVVMRCSTEQHLTKGNRTDRDNAARVYFDAVYCEGLRLIAVLYCGPHPLSSFTVDLDLGHLLGY